MAVALPTVDEIVERFPAFEGQEDLIELLIPEAAKFVSETWSVDDQIVAVKYMVASMIASETGEAATRSGVVVSESFGPMSRTYKTSDSSNPLFGNEWGRRFLAIRMRYGGASIAVVGGDS